jgi:cell division protein FtsI/penicillin-binding protein 2
MELSFSPGGRARGLAMALIALMALFVMRLFYIQVIQHGYYVDQAENEQVKQFVLHAKRGEIYAMDGDTPTKIVMNETVYTAWVDPTQVTDRQKIVDELNRVAGGNTRKDFAQYIDMKKTRYQVLATKLSRTQAEMLKKENIAGLGFDGVSQRVYPEGQLASQVLGFVDAEGDGKYGLEQAKNDDLKGKDGLLKTVTDVRMVPLTVGNSNIRKPAVDGKNIVLTIDRSVQAEVEKALADGMARSGAKRASAIVMDPETGKVLSMATLPSYDPSQLSSIPNAAVLNNGTISSPYEAGSDIKTFTVAAGIDKGVITPESTYDNTGQITVADTTINNATKTAALTGNISMQTALNWSLNTGMVTIARRLGDGNQINRTARDTMYDYFHNRFRLGQRTGIELANEAQGTVISPEDQNGNAVQYATMSFGQGMNVTMLQVVSGFSAIINGGTYNTPSIIAGTMDSTGTFQPAATKLRYPGVISAASSDTVREMVHQSHYATYNPHDGSDSYYIGGKTGTSQVPDYQKGGYSTTETIGTYLGFGGETNQKPSYVIMVEVSGAGQNLGGGTDAKPIFNAISNWMIDYLKLSPTNE